MAAIAPYRARSFYQEVALGRHPGYSIVNIFGSNSDVDTTPEAITSDGVYEMPQVSGAATLRVKAGNANDTAAGSGARTITLEGIGTDGSSITEDINTNGGSAGTASTQSFLRLTGAYIKECGTYGTVGSDAYQAADVVIETTGGTEWAKIPKSDRGRGESQIGCYTVPLGKTAYITYIAISADSGKTINVEIQQRQSILDTSPPYESFRTIYEAIGLAGAITNTLPAPVGPFPALTDIVPFASVPTTAASVEIELQLLLVDDAVA